MTSRCARFGLLGGVAVALLCGAPVSAARDRHRRIVHASAISVGSIGSFTPAAANPRFAASLARAGLEPTSGFRFTPSSAPGSKRSVTVAVRARASTVDQAERVAMSSINPYAYNLGVAAGWKRFALSSDYAKVDLGPVPGSHESADVALSYAGHRWSTRVALAADRALDEVPRLIGPERNVSVDLGGSYSINTRLDVTGGVRYRMDRDQLPAVADDRHDSQAVYIGTAFRF